MTVLRLVLADQLNAAHPWFRTVREDVVYVFMEVRSETDYVRHHAQKVLALFAAMRLFEQAIASVGHRTLYLRIGDPRNRQSIPENLSWIGRDLHAATVERMEADEWRVERLLARALPDTRPVSAHHFLCERDEIAARFADRVPRMEVFYRDMRRRLGLLMEDGQPVGERWNFDAENRAKWRGDPPAPVWTDHTRDLSALWEEITAAGVQTLGEPAAARFPWPLTRREARERLAAFIAEALPFFGRYQDAMSTASRTLFHSGLSFSLNTKMLHPLEVVEAAIAAWRQGAADLAAVEGFVRQIIGWREFVRGVYWGRMPAYGALNALNATRPLPSFYWTGETDMACLRQAVTQTLETAYAHHIQRLMVTGNFALLAGLDPDAVEAWYLGVYIDACEWVEMPNTRGMVLFADGGVVGSKPYAASASYMHKQGDYCTACRFNRTKRHGEGACPFNALYWHFLHRNAGTLGRNPRLAMPYRAFDKLAGDEQAATLAHAERVLEAL